MCVCVCAVFACCMVASLCVCVCVVRLLERLPSPERVGSVVGPTYAVSVSVDTAFTCVRGCHRLVAWAGHNSQSHAEPSATFTRRVEDAVAGSSRLSKRS